MRQEAIVKLQVSVGNSFGMAVPQIRRNPVLPGWEVLKKPLETANDVWTESEEVGTGVWRWVLP